MQLEYVLNGIAASAKLGFLAGLVLIGLWAYRRLRMPTMPWLIAYWLISAATSYRLPALVPQVIDHISIEWVSGLGMTLGTFIQCISALGSFMGTLSMALATWFVIAEFAFLVSQRSASNNVSIPRAVLVPRTHATTLGLILIGTVLVMPIIWMLLWIA